MFAKYLLGALFFCGKTKVLYVCVLFLFFVGGVFMPNLSIYLPTDLWLKVKDDPSAIIQRALRREFDNILV